jgi:hypothetical protein
MKSLKTYLAGIVPTQCTRNDIARHEPLLLLKEPGALMIDLGALICQYQFGYWHVAQLYYTISKSRHALTMVIGNIF